MGTGSFRRVAAALLAAGALAACSRAPAPRELAVAGWPLSLVPPAGADAETVRKLVSVAARAARDAVPGAPETARVRIELSPSRVLSPPWAAPRPVAAQAGDEVRVGWRTDDLAATANRLAHELVHWRLEKRCGARTALWLDEGLAQAAGRAAAREAGRCFSLDVSERPAPAWTNGLAALLSAETYPPGSDEAAAFYAAALRLADAFLARHGRADALALAAALAADPSAEAFFGFCAARYRESAEEIAGWLR